MRLATLLSAVLLPAAACGEGDHRDANTELVVDTVAGRIVVSNPGGGAAATHASRVFLIGEEEGAPQYTFGGVSALAVDSAGRLYVADAMADAVRVYDPAGEFIQEVGRRGDGPGEFRGPTGLAFHGAGVLHVRDETRVQRFAPAEPGGVAARYAGSHPGPPYAFSLMPTRFDAAGRLYYPMRAGRIPDQRYFFLVYDSAGQVVDTLPLPPSVRVPPETAIFRSGASGGRMVPGLARAPFAPIPAWDLTAEGRLLVSDGRSYEVVELDRGGDTVRVIRRADERERVPSGEYDDSVQAVRRRVAEAPAPLDRLDAVAEEIRRDALPRTLPQVTGITVGRDGRIWVRRWPSQGSGSTYDAFTREGIFERRIQLRGALATAPSPVFTGARVYGVIVDPETEVQRVAAYDLP